MNGNHGFDPENLPSDAGEADFSGITREQARAVFEHLSDAEVTSALRRIDAARTQARDARDLMSDIVAVVVEFGGAALRKVLT